jgi:hypothetical protein
MPTRFASKYTVFCSSASRRCFASASLQYASIIASSPLLRKIGRSSFASRAMISSRPPRPAFDVAAGRGN